MTKEELEKEAEEKYFNHKMADFQGFYNRHYYCLGYLESAEPREKRIAELEKEKCELLGIIQGKDKVIQELKKELNSMMVSKNQQLTKAKEIIEELSSSLSVVGECDEEECELLNQAEQFLREVEK